MSVLTTVRMEGVSDDLTLGVKEFSTTGFGGNQGTGNPERYLVEGRTVDRSSLVRSPVHSHTRSVFSVRALD